MAKPLLSKHSQRMCIYIGESDRWQRKPLYIAILEALKTAGMAGATVTRGVAGFGAHSNIRTASILRLSEDLPLLIEVVDSPENIHKAIDLISPMVNEGLITLEEVQVIKYTHRYLTPLPADRPVKEVMSTVVITLSPDDTLTTAWKQMQGHLLKGLPVIDKDMKPVGMLTDDDLLTRSGIKDNIEAGAGWNEKNILQELTNLDKSGKTVADLMSQPAIIATGREPLGHAASHMAREGLKRLPVVDQEGRLIGVLSRLDILRQVAEYQPLGKHGKTPTGAAVTLDEIINPDVPIIRLESVLPEIVEALLEYQSRYLIVLDSNDRVIGKISDEEVLKHVQTIDRIKLLNVLHLLAAPPYYRIKAEKLVSADVLTAPVNTTLAEAARLMIKGRYKWLVVVNDDIRPVGVVDRQILLGAITGI